MDQLFSALRDGAQHYGLILLGAVPLLVLVKAVMLRFQKDLDSLVLDALSPVLLVDLAQNKILLANTAAMQLLGIRQQSLLLLPLRFIHVRHSTNAQLTLWAAVLASHFYLAFV